MGQFAQQIIRTRRSANVFSLRARTTVVLSATAICLTLAAAPGALAQSPRTQRHLPEIYFRPPTQSFARAARDMTPPSRETTSPSPTAVASGNDIRQPEFIRPEVVANRRPPRQRLQVATAVKNTPVLGEVEDSLTVEQDVQLVSLAPADTLAERALLKEPEELREPEGLIEPQGLKKSAGPNDPEEPQEPQELAGALHLEEAEQLAGSASTQDKFTEVIELCERSLRAGLEREADTLARRLGAWAYNRRGESLAAADASAALFDFQQAIQLDPTCWQAVHNRAVSYAMSGQHALALVDFNRVLRLNPDAATAYRNRGELLAVMGRTQAAVDDYTEAIERLPDDALLHNMRGHAHHRLGEFRRAVQDLNQSIRLAEHNPSAYTNRGNLYAELGYYQQSLSDFESALDQDDAWWPAMRGMAWTLATATDPDIRDASRSVAMAEQARVLSPPDEKMVLETLAAALASDGRFSEAVELQHAAMANVPDAVRPGMEQRLQLYESERPFLSEPQVPPVAESPDPSVP